jgi:tetratricopeptide (TPR) repeat protein
MSDIKGSVVRACCIGVILTGMDSFAQERSWEEMNSQATQLQMQGQFVEAEDLFQSALKLLKESAADDPRLAAALNNLASVCQDLGRNVEAERLYLRAVARLETAYGKDHPSLATPLGNLAAMYTELGQGQRAERLGRRMMALRFDGGANQTDLAKKLQVIGGAYLAQRRYAEAEPLYRQAVSIWEKDRQWLKAALGLNNLSTICLQTQRPAEAASLLTRALGILEGELPPDHPDLVRPLANLAVVYLKLKQQKEAEGLLLRALAIAESRFGPRHELYGKVLLYYGQALRQGKHTREASHVERLAQEILAAAASDSPARHTVDVSDLMRPPHKP